MLNKTISIKNINDEELYHFIEVSLLSDGDELQVYYGNYENILVILQDVKFLKIEPSHILMKGYLKTDFCFKPVKIKIY